jgi:hypothetical protein
VAPAVPLYTARDQFEREYILRQLALQQGNISRTAEVLGVERSNLYRKMRAFGIAPSRSTPARTTQRKKRCKWLRLKAQGSGLKAQALRVTDTHQPFTDARSLSGS